MHGWSYEDGHDTISFNFNGGMDGGELFITVPDCEKFVERRAPFAGVHGPQVLLKLPVKSIIDLVFSFYIAPRIIGMFEIDVAGWFSRLTDEGFWARLKRLAEA